MVTGQRLRDLGHRDWSREAMTNTCVLMTDMGILVVIFLLGFLAKVFPKSGRNAGSKQ